MNIIPNPGEQGPGSFISPDYPEAEIHAMQRAVLKLFERWDITESEAATLLGGLSIRTLARWRDGGYGRVGRDLADRMSNLLGVHKALRIVYRDAARGYAWIKRPNDAFAGRSALDVMKQGGLQDIVRVRAYLDSVRGGW